MASIGTGTTITFTDSAFTAEFTKIVIRTERDHWDGTPLSTAIPVGLVDFGGAVRPVSELCQVYIDVEFWADTTDQVPLNAGNERWVINWADGGQWGGGSAADVNNGMAIVRFEMEATVEGIIRGSMELVQSSSAIFT